MGARECLLHRTCEGVSRRLRAGGDGLAGEQFAALAPINYANDFGARTLVFESWRFSVEKHHELVQARYADRAEPIVS